MNQYQPRRYTSQVMDGIAKYLHETGFATYRREGEYLPSERGIYFDRAPGLDDPKPIETLVISPYLPGSGRMAIENTRIQIRMRHLNRGKLEIRDLMDDLRDLFPNNKVLMFGGHFFDRVYQTSATAWVEPDRQDVTESSQNFMFRGNRYRP